MKFPLLGTIVSLVQLVVSANSHLETRAPSGTTKLLSVFNPIIVDHFYSTNESEVELLVNYYGFKLEGPKGTTTGYLYTDPQPGTIPLFQLYAIGITDHFYTTSVEERDHAIKRLGYTLEGTLGYVYTSSGSGRTPLYRLHNPVGPESHDHYYTTSAQEREDASRNGWADEGYVGYILS